MKYSRPPDFKSSSNVSLPFAWITGPASDPACEKYKRQEISNFKVDSHSIIGLLSENSGKKRSVLAHCAICFRSHARNNEHTKVL